MSRSSPVGSPPDVGVLLPAAGLGERAGGGTRKQFRPVAGVPLLLRSLQLFAGHPRVAAIVVALPPADAERPPPWLADVAGPRLRVVAGGATRAASVGAALAALDPACHIVLVHDAARPFVARETVDAVIAAAARGVGAVAAVPVSDTLKRARGDARVVETVDRAGLWRAQTPQGFPRRVLEEAYRRAGASALEATDDAFLVEAAGHPVELVLDTSDNIKITTPEDFVLAEALANR